jgi:hypothetical protein
MKFRSSWQRLMRRGKWPGGKWKFRGEGKFKFDKMKMIPYFKYLIFNDLK